MRNHCLEHLNCGLFFLQLEVLTHDTLSYRLFLAALDCWIYAWGLFAHDTVSMLCNQRQLSHVIFFESWLTSMSCIMCKSLLMRSIDIET